MKWLIQVYHLPDSNCLAEVSNIGHPWSADLDHGHSESADMKHAVGRYMLNLADGNEFEQRKNKQHKSNNLD